MPSDPDARFWDRVDRLVRTSKIVIDRPAGKTHPRFPEFVYPFDYGYLSETDGGDGGGIDVWVGASGEHEVVGAIVTVDQPG